MKLGSSGLLQFCRQTLFRILSSGETLLDFLRLCGRLYKYDFQTQEFIFAMRPDATAAAIKQIWEGESKPRSHAITVLSDDRSRVINFLNVRDFPLRVEEKLQ